ncbi:hypothetical protein K32_12050 [Kaistia sp. 32K]|uniref:hypothetical protein n=1 Tax=Kaistia sp. 32K TaxID=2795690 RepID=UPI00191623A3|nr:hypothetical protein [Kaistia sp. 32K]BCP52588.1 hypothetical protein K32_12050 [Kaistia sp. 32K]
MTDGSSSGGGGNVVNNALFGAPNKNLQNATIVSAENFGYTVNCPPVAVRPGTEEFKVLAPGKPDPITGAGPPVVYQVAITDTARECFKAPGGGVTVKLGIKGRVASGPAGKAQTVNVPVRVVVMEGRDKVLKSELHRIAVPLQAPELAADFTKIDESIVVPISEGNTDFHIYVGLDDKATPAKQRRS